MPWMRKRDFIRNFELYFFLVAALLIIPGNTTGAFNGLPLSSIPELSGFLVLLFGILSSKFKSNFKQVSAKISPRYLVAFILIFGIAIPAKFALKHGDLPTGRFDACYHSYVRSDDMKVPECEPFFSAKFEGGRSRLDEGRSGGLRRTQVGKASRRLVRRSGKLDAQGHLDRLRPERQ